MHTTNTDLLMEIAATINTAKATIKNIPEIAAAIGNDPDKVANIMVTAVRDLDQALIYLNNLYTQHRELAAQKDSAIHLANLIFSRLGQAVIETATQNILLQQQVTAGQDAHP